MEEGSITCKDGFVQKLEKAKRSTDEFGFNQKQKRGLSAVAQHTAEAVIAHLNDTEKENPTIQAHQINPFNPQPTAMEQDEPRVSVFKRVGEANLSKSERAKKAKTVRFLESLSEQ